MLYKIIKRAFDLFFSFLLTLVVLVLLPFLAIAIKVSSPGPVFYVSMRVGKNGKPFKFYKFRTMNLRTGNFQNIAQEQKRIFPLGNFMRRSKLDELPQVINVLKGDMSVVGPRPMLISNVDAVYGGCYKGVLSVKPGLTSYASLFDYTHGDLCTNDANLYMTTILPIKQNLELLYVERAGLLTDLMLFGKTAVIIIAVILGKKNFRYSKEYYIAKSHLEARNEADM